MAELENKEAILDHVAHHLVDRDLTMEQCLELIGSLWQFAELEGITLGVKMGLSVAKEGFESGVAAGLDPANFAKFFEADAENVDGNFTDIREKLLAKLEQADA